METKFRKALYHGVLSPPKNFHIQWGISISFQIERFQKQFCSARFAEEWVIEDKNHLLINTCNFILGKFPFPWLSLLIYMQVVGDNRGETDYCSLILEMLEQTKEMVSFVPTLLEDSWRGKKKESELPQLHNPVICEEKRKCCNNSVKKSIKKET